MAYPTVDHLARIAQQLSIEQRLVLASQLTREGMQDLAAAIAVQAAMETVREGRGATRGAALMDGDIRLAFAVLVIASLVYALLKLNARIEARRRREFNRRWYERERSQVHGEFDR